MQMVKFPSIDQFRTVVKNVRHRAKHHEVPIPTITFQGTVKLHGCNVSVCFDPRTNETWCQSREQIITTEKDNYGFASFIENLPDNGFRTYLNIAAGIFGMTSIKPGDLICVYGEWCGKSIQQKVAISEVSKRFVVFAIKIYTPGETTEDGQDGGISQWFSPTQLVQTQNMYEHETGQVLENRNNIFSIQKFKTWTIEIDFAHPELIQNQLIEWTNEVEHECPVGKAFGVLGVGEGVVYTSVNTHEFIQTSDLIFKVKGDKHSDTKVTKTASVDIEKVNSVNEFANNVVTDHRLEKIIEKMKVEGLEIDVKNTGIFLKMVGEDILKEESDTIEGSGLTRKDVMPVVNSNARQWYMRYYNDLIIS